MMWFPTDFFRLCLKRDGDANIFMNMDPVFFAEKEGGNRPEMENPGYKKVDFFMVKVRMGR